MPQGYEQVILDRSRKRVEKEQEQSRFQVMEKGMKIMSLIQAARHMIQAKHRGEYAHQFDEADLRAKIQTIEQCMKKLRNLDSPKHVKIPRFADVSQVAQAGARDTEDQDFEEEEVVEPKPEMFLTQARREELVELIRRMNTKVQKYKKRQPNLELQLQELREEKYCRQLQWMDQKKELKEEIDRLQLKVNAFTGLNSQTDMRKLLSHLEESRAEAKAPNVDVEGAFSKRAGTNIQFSEDRMIATRVEVMGNQALVFGSSPIPKDASGWFYSVEVNALPRCKTNQMHRDFCTEAWPSA